MRQIHLTPHLFNHVEVKNMFVILVYDMREFHPNERVDICLVYSNSNGVIAARFEAIILEIEPSIALTTDLQVQRITVSRAEML